SIVEPPASKKSGIWFRALRLSLAVALLAYVGSVLPWADHLDVDGLRWQGEIVGDWKSQRIQFRVEEMNDLGDTPLSVAGVWLCAQETGTVFFVERDHLEVPTVGGIRSIEGTLDWQPGLPRAVSELEFKGLLPAFGMLLVAALAAVTRWWRLLVISECYMSWTRAFRITFYGLFVNLIVPGLAGADVLRSVIVVRDHPDKKTIALLTVFVDRLIGFVAMVLLSLIAIFSIGERTAALRLPVAGILVALIVALTIQAHPRARKFLAFERRLKRLPGGEMLARLDGALAHFAGRPVEMLTVLALSLLNHLAASGTVYLLSSALGGTLDFIDCVCVLTITNTLAAMPITPGGWGIGEAAYTVLFPLLGGTATVGVAVSVLFRVLMALLGVLGGAFLFLPGGAQARAEFQEFRASREST
ncbi:MAG: hypothetical protein ACI835_005411, partial [Planctomycetota bacterium]